MRENSRPPASPGAAVVLATRNPGKVRELAVLLRPFGLRVLGLSFFPEAGEIKETGVTFADNALLKAGFTAKATGFVAVADDSGLEADALGGVPGVFSARYSAGEASTDAGNVEKLLKEMHGVEAGRRTARFRCCMAACTPQGDRITAEGTWEGRIAEKAAGENGFGYDPVFLDFETGLTAAQMTAEEKNRRSHRAAAAAGLVRLWPSFWDRWLRVAAG
ncbi:MAG: RdgB/HAM1 family non-canonical purine NTP pyrophosphatase [Desulfovibrio sp.]|jgi:XTP/dITP diphosphohydrolase|nr:RdgB/HAM1 family non-canonical purine NTP pyrophosphatase [Desulfovibrio sp.]